MKVKGNLYHKLINGYIVAVIIKTTNSKSPKLIYVQIKEKFLIPYDDQRSVCNPWWLPYWYPMYFLLRCNGTPILKPAKSVPQASSLVNFGDTKRILPKFRFNIRSKENATIFTHKTTEEHKKCILSNIYDQQCLLRTKSVKTALKTKIRCGGRECHTATHDWFARQRTPVGLCERLHYRLWQKGFASSYHGGFLESQKRRIKSAFSLLGIFRNSYRPSGMFNLGVYNYISHWLVYGTDFL